MPQRFRVRITSRFRRDAQKLLKQHPDLVDVLEQLQATLAADPYNRSHEHDIKKLSGLSKGEGQWRIRVGIYRVRYDIAGRDVVLYSFRHRREVY